MASDDKMTKRLQIEVFSTPSGVVTVTSKRPDGGGGIRLCGVKLVASGSEKVAEFHLDRAAVEALLEEFGDDE